MLRIGRALLFVISLVPLPVWAQGQGTTFGAIIGGATLSDMSGLSATNDSRWGATAGLMIGYNAWRTASAIEANWIQKGGGDTRLDYIELPLTVGGIVANSNGSMRGRFYSGISVAFKTGCSSTVPSCDNAEGTEWGWPIGLQFARATGSAGFVGLDVRYSIPLSEAFELTGIHNRPWQFRLMFGKRLGSS